MLNNIVNRYLTKLARITEGKVFIEGYRSMWPASKDAFAYINVSGNTFPIKDELVRAGLRWNPNSKSWGLSVSSQGDGFRQYDRIAPKIDKAFDVLEPLVQKFNAEVDQRNKALSPRIRRGCRKSCATWTACSAVPSSCGRRVWNFAAPRRTQMACPN